ncbi:MAG: glycosyltransferase, partial [Rhodospirillaceae bacterium]|nr:glycosyltransferase [Rhodospirillaceae bacterium]
ARGAHVITIDDDLQNPPSEVMRLYEYALNSGKDVVYSRYARKQHATWRNLGSWFANCCANTLFDKPKELYLSSFRCMNQFCATEISRYEGPYPYVDGLIMQCTNSFASIEVEHHTRTEGRSGYTLKKLIQLWMRIALNFSVIPLRICTLIGLMVSLMGFGGIIWVFADYVMNGVSAPGWTTLMIFMITFSGVQLIMLGIVGEYLGRLFMTANRKPQSVVRDVIRTVDRLGENTTEEVTLI